MATPPPIPARPSQLTEPSQPGAAPPVPPLPPGFRLEDPEPRSGTPMIAPRPQKNFSNAPADMAQSLEAQSYYNRSFPVPIPGGAYRGPSPAPPPPPNQFPSAGVDFPRPMSTAYPDFQGQGYASPPPFNIPLQGSYGAPQGQAQQGIQPFALANGSQFNPPHASSLPTALARMSVNDSAGHTPPPFAPAPPKEYDVTAPAVFRPELIPFAPIIPKPSPGQPPILTCSLPSVESLTAAASSVASQDNPARQLAWSRQVLNLVDHTLSIEQQMDLPKSSPDAPIISNAQLLALTDQAILQVLALCDTSIVPFPPYVPEALYLRATLEASGLFPKHVPKDLRASFKDFEVSARNGYHAGWFRIGRDYEGVQDWRRARDTFERGVRLGEKNCLYRMGMAHLQGQLDLPRNPELAIPLLKQSADHADVESPQAAYVFGMILLGEYSHIDIPSITLIRYLPRPSSNNPDPRMTEAKRYIERAAYLNFAPAQTKAGWAHEFAKMGCAYDPLLSVQYYSLASQQGEEEADMALSKWFLCGAEGHFEKEEYLAYTFAEKAARKGLPTAEFAMGYYNEIGVGGNKDLVVAKKWYEKAASHNNTDAIARVKALSQQYPEIISRAQHETITHNKLVRKRTQAKTDSTAAGRRPVAADGRHATQVAQSAAEASSRIMPPRASVPSPINTPPPANSRPVNAQPRVHHFGRGSADFGGRRGNISSPAAPISLDGPPPPSQASPPRQQPQRPPQSQQQQQQPPPRTQTQPPQSAATPPAAPAAAPQPQASSANGPKKGPATFAEMGYHSQALDDKECVIM